MTRVPSYLELPEEPLKLEGFGSRLPAWHVFEKEDVEAVNAALAAGRPLLVRGEPGVGKSQLARAAAKGLGRAFVSAVIDIRTEARDLQWTFDAVRRLADAQVLAARGATLDGQDDPLDALNYTEPRALWWAFDWDGAQAQAGRARTKVPLVPQGCSPANGVVVLLDEMDKADSSVPNGLLGCLGDGFFEGPGGTTVQCQGVHPLVVVTTNEERSLPDAFLRRCVVHHLSLPQDQQELYEWLVARGRAHFSDQLEDDILSGAVGLLWEDRQHYRSQGLAPPGCAEYLDLLRILSERSKVGEDPAELLDVAARYVFRKHPPEPTA